MELQKGQKLKLTDLTAATQVALRVRVQMGAGEADITCFGVDEQGKLSDDRYFVFYNQTSSPEGAIALQQESGGALFSVDLACLPSNIQKLVVTVAAEDDKTMRDIIAGSISLEGGGEHADYAFGGDAFTQERALILCELYRKNEIWRYSVVASGFNGGLSALLAHYGGQEIAPVSAPPAKAPAPTPAPTPAPPTASKVNLSKINLTKSGETHKIDLSKNSGEIHANLNWNMGQKKLFGGTKSIDLDLACMYRLKDGTQGVIQALGGNFGSTSAPPYILLDQDDRSGTSAKGENMYFKRPELLDFAVVFAFIYEGIPNWRGTDAAVLLHQQGSPDIEIRIDNPNTKDRFCVLATLSARSGSLEVKREERYFPSHREVDQCYHFGFNWVAGRK